VGTGDGGGNVRVNWAGMVTVAASTCGVTDCPVSTATCVEEAAPTVTVTAPAVAGTTTPKTPLSTAPSYNGCGANADAIAAPRAGPAVTSVPTAPPASTARRPPGSPPAPTRTDTSRYA